MGDTWENIKTAGIVSAIILIPVALIQIAYGNPPPAKLKTLAFHVCEKPQHHAPDVQHIYQQILAANNGKYPDVLLLPELGEHEDWEEELEWIEDNFSGIPLMLEVFGGGSGETPTPQLTTTQISAAMAVANVKWLRVAEVVSWHIEHSRPFPTEYVTTILNFCRAHGLKLFWTEWKVNGVFQAIATYIAGFKDIVTVSFSTNSLTEPDAGFNLLKGLLHWGASIQAWYWVTRHGQDPSTLMDMPIQLMVEHSILAKNKGAEVIQFEPYWYFFDNGIARPSLGTVLGAL